MLLPSGLVLRLKAMVPSGLVLVFAGCWLSVGGAPLVVVGVVVVVVVVSAVWSYGEKLTALAERAVGSWSGLWCVLWSLWFVLGSWVVCEW